MHCAVKFLSSHCTVFIIQSCMVDWLSFDTGVYNWWISHCSRHLSQPSKWDCPCIRLVFHGAY
jgi:hypothetical protein